MKKRVIILDDDPKMVKLLSSVLSEAGFTPHGFSNGNEALVQVKVLEPCLIFSDVKMPDIDGYSVLEKLRTFSDIPFIYLTNFSDSANKVKGLNLGADDYLTKPFSPDELLARVNVVLRRAGGHHAHIEDDVYVLDTLKLNFTTQRLMVGSMEVMLTAKEMKLFTMLARNYGRVFMHEDLLSTVWGDKYVDNTEYLRVAINRIRSKLLNAGFKKDIIKTYSGVGYMILDPSLQ